MLPHVRVGLPYSYIYTAYQIQYIHLKRLYIRTYFTPTAAVKVLYATYEWWWGELKIEQLYV